MDALWQDVRYALRTLARSPGFTAVGVLVLALAIGVNTAIFSLVNALIFKGLDVEDPQTLRFLVSERTSAGRPEPFVSYGLSYRALLDLRASDPLFADAFGFSMDRARLRTGREIRLTQGERVTANYFDMLRVRPGVGRLFSAGDESPSAEPVVVVSHDLWRSRFNADPAVIGTILPLDVVRYSALSAARAYTIIGVAPPGFRGMYKFQPTEFWVLHVQRALDPDPDARAAARRPDPIGSGGLAVAIRLAEPGRESEMTSLLGGIARHVHTAHYREALTFSLRLEADRPNRVPFDRTGRMVPSRLAAGLLALAGLVALIGLANLTGLLAARGVTRRAEMTVRLTLGASTTRVFRQAFVEGVLISLAATVFALVAVVWLLNTLVATMPEASTSGTDLTLPIVPGIPVDWRVLLYASGSAIVSTLIMAAVPFRQSRRLNLLDDLREGGSSASGGIKPRLQRIILIPQVCCCVILIVVSGVVARTLLREELRPSGYDASHVISISYVRPYRPYPSYPYVPAEIRAYTDATLAQIERVLLQIETHTQARIALTNNQFSGTALPASNSVFVARDGFSMSPRHTWLKMLDVTHHYFNVMRIPIVLGRGFSKEDRVDSELVVVVSQDLARRLWPDESAIGKYLGMHQPGDGHVPRWQRVVGVAGDITLPLSEGNPTPSLFTLSSQGGRNDGTLIARHEGDPSALIEDMKALLAKADPAIMIAGTHMVSDAIDAMLFPRRLTAVVLGLAAACGLVLACVGLYGIVSYSVAQRVREIGIRTTLGAQRRDIMRLVIRDGLLVTVAGCALGLVLAYAGVKLVSSNLVALPAMGIGPVVAAPLILLIAMLLATYIPARRAASVDPMIALRRL